MLRDRAVLAACAAVGGGEGRGVVRDAGPASLSTRFGRTRGSGVRGSAAPAGGRKPRTGRRRCAGREAASRILAGECLASALRTRAVPPPEHGAALDGARGPLGYHGGVERELHEAGEWGSGKGVLFPEGARGRRGRVASGRGRGAGLRLFKRGPALRLRPARPCLAPRPLSPVCAASEIVTLDGWSSVRGGVAGICEIA